MNIPVETKPALWGAVGGAVAAAIIGFNWGGWVTGSRAETDASQRAGAAVVAAVAPICADKFKNTADMPVRLEELKKVDSWSQGAFVEKGGWATVPGTLPPDQVTAIAKACALLLVPG